MPVANGDTVSVHYVGTLDDGTQFDTSRKNDEPLVTTVGAGEVIKGFEEALIGMEKGETKTIHLSAEDAYGERAEEAVTTVPRNMFPEDAEPQLGGMVGVKLPDGNVAPARITAVTDEEITLDLNHPLAGERLTFELEVVDY